MTLAEIVMRRIEALGKVSEDPRHLTRTFCSPAMREANDLVGQWMRDAGMVLRQDAIGNLIGRFPCDRAPAKTLLLGSHLDTVRCAGKFDGPLGVLVALACVEAIRAKKIRLPFAIEAIAFADEEGVRYQSTYLGSRVMAGKFSEQDLQRVDAEGISMAEAIRAFGGEPSRLQIARLDPEKLLGYAEVHIEQGPVLENAGLAVGVVSAIAGQTRAKISFIGRAGHAGTTPMALRSDALCAAAEFITAVESHARKISGLVATVGQIEISPGASNVIPAGAKLTLDIRHQNDSKRNAAVKFLRGLLKRISLNRGVAGKWELVQETSAIPCSPQLSALLAHAVGKHQEEVLRLPSGAGHDAAVMAAIAPVAMLFVRCKGGISHHPNESVKTADVRTAIAVMGEFILSLARNHE